jgi:hypothetical protein
MDLFLLYLTNRIITGLWEIEQTNDQIYFHQKTFGQLFSPRAFLLQFNRRKTFKLNFQLSISLHKKSQSFFELSRNLELKIKREIMEKKNFLSIIIFRKKRKFVDNAIK